VLVVLGLFPCGSVMGKRRLRKPAKLKAVAAWRARAPPLNASVHRLVATEFGERNRVSARRHAAPEDRNISGRVGASTVARIEVKHGAVVMDRGAVAKATRKSMRKAASMGPGIVVKVGVVKITKVGIVKTIAAEWRQYEIAIGVKLHSAEVRDRSR